MNEIVLTETEEVVERAHNPKDAPSVTMTRDYVYFNVAFCELINSKRVTISRSGPYIIFREAASTENSYAITYKNHAAQVGSYRLAQILNPGRQKRTYPVHPVKGGGWCIKVF